MKPITFDELEQDILAGFNDAASRFAAENPVLASLIRGLNLIKKFAPPQGSGFDFKVVMGDGHGVPLGHVALETTIIGPMRDIVVAKQGHILLTYEHGAVKHTHPQADEIRQVVREYAALALHAGQAIFPDGMKVNGEFERAGTASDSTTTAPRMRERKTEISKNFSDSSF